MKTLAALALSVAALLGGCDPYNPSLGDKPFLCGSDEPRCPEGYVAIEESATACSCQRTGASAVDANPNDGAAFQCNVDGNEPNDTTSTPTDTGLGGATTTYASDPIAVCVAGDVDVFALDAESGQTVTARLLYAGEQGELVLQLLADDGTELATGAPISGGQEASVEVENTERHLVRVQAADDVENNYTLSIEVTTP